MATQEEMHTVLAKAAASKSFRDKLSADPAAATSSIGIKLDAAQLTALKGSAAKLQNATLDLKVSDKVAKLLMVWI